MIRSLITMRAHLPHLAAAVAALCFFTPMDASAIAPNQVDDFQNGTAMSWREGDQSPNPPTNIAAGGPGGAGDRYLENASSGGSGPGSRMVMFNQAQWVGNYNAAGVNRITAQMANFGTTTTLNMRIWFRGGSGTQYGSNTATTLPADGVWRIVTFDLTESALTNMGGPDTVAQALASVSELRIVSAVGGASSIGDSMVGTLGVDNITATSIPVPVPMITEFVFLNDSPRLSFTTVAGKTYRVERKDSLLAPDWIVLSNAGNIAGTGGVIQVNDPQSGVRSLPRRFYRVVLVDG